MRGLGSVLVASSIALALSVAVAACSQRIDIQPLGYKDVSAADRVVLDDASNKQIQLGFQIKAAASSEDMAEQCHEMCNRSEESCRQSMIICDVSRKYPAVQDFVARCEVSRERCRVHKGHVPRECGCEFALREAGGGK